MTKSLLSALVVLAFPAHAKLFSNAYVSFELPPNWECQRDGTEWVCVSQFSKKPKEAMIVLTAKEVGPNDTLAAYMGVLKEPRSLPPGPSGRAVTTSKVLHVKQVSIANQPWIDSLHLGSEVADYYTRYMATTKERIAILVTFSAHKLHYTKYSNDFIRAVNSLRATASKSLISQPQSGSGVRGSNEPLGQPIGPIMGPNAISPEDVPPERSRGNLGQVKKVLGLALIGIAIGIFLLLRKQKKRKKR